MAKNESSLSQDFTSALNQSLKPGKIIVMAPGLLVGIAAAILFFWLGGMIKPQGLRWLSWIVQRFGALIFVYFVLASMTSAVAMAHAQATGGRIGVRGGWGLIAKSIGPVVIGTLKPIIMFIASLAIIWVAGALGAIPEAGPIIWGIISIVPVAAGLLAIFILARLVVIGFVFPAVLSVKKESGLACYRESVRFAKGHACLVLGRLAIAALAALVFYQIVCAGFSMTATHSSRTMGDNALTLRGSRLFGYLAGVPGIFGTAPRGFALQSPASSFQEQAARIPIAVPAEKLPERDLRSVLRRGLTGEAARPAAVRKATHKVGGWIFSVVFIVAATVPCSIPLLFLALSGYRTFMSFKDSEEIPLETVEVSLPQKKKTAEEMPDKKPEDVAKKASEKGRARGGKGSEAKPKKPRGRAPKK